MTEIAPFQVAAKEPHPFMNIAEMCITCQGYWAQFRDALLDLGVRTVRCYNWYFITDIKKWK